MNKDVRFFYLHDRKGFPRVCVARLVKDKKVVFGYSVYDPKDKYNKHLARKIATNRLFFELEAAHPNRITGGVVSIDNGRNPIVAIVEALTGKLVMENCDCHDLPSCDLVMSLARRWLRENNKPQDEKLSPIVYNDYVDIYGHEW